ncbi:glutathione S-transferase family protein [Saccharospirillum mangrovi]|uniref:glutathione S-transferase family protein n=1 Tax=Saccharospirillum mangrovi TaxID=2161747 RepID=UPI000D34FEED|nr:glutathione S-transferase family protein [Saccharospirillum mangrovi]
MSLKLYSHPLASYCHKVLIALYEAGTEFEPLLVDLSDPGEHSRYLDVWPVGKMPVLRDEDRNETIPESSIIIEYLQQHYLGAQLLPIDPATCLQARLWDRFFDLYVHEPMQKIVFDSFRADDDKDHVGVLAAQQRLEAAYEMVEKQLSGKAWMVGEHFSIADCSAAPALFFASILVPFKFDQLALRDYFERLVERSSFRRVLVEAQPYFENFPFHDKIPQPFLTMTL